MLNARKRKKLVTYFEKQLTLKIGLVSRFTVFHCRVAGEKQIDVTGLEGRKWPPIWNLLLHEYR